jgi:RNA polymerase sigma-70 factor (ECF subfamily)
MSRERASSLYRSEISYVLRCLRSLGTHASDLDDLGQEVFIRAFRSLARFEGHRPVRPWLFAILYCTLQNSRRRNGRRSAAEEALALLVPPGKNPDRDLEHEDDRRLISTALQSIQPERRRLFLMVELEGRSVAEAAGLLRVPLNTAYSRLRLARRGFAAAVRRLTLAGGRQIRS